MPDSHQNTTPPQSVTIDGNDWPIWPAPMPDTWVEIARTKGFDLIARIGDRYHLAARCHDCGELTRTKVFTLRSAQPLCQPCLRSRHEAVAAAAGLTFLRRDPNDTQYAFYRMACGHEIRRQFGCTQRVAEGAHGLRCAICQLETEAVEADTHGWELLGPDPQGDANYRLYRHAEGCGHEQRIARVNMQTGRFGCSKCSEGWAAAPSALYLMRFTLPGDEVVLKLGYAARPQSRLRHQLLRDKALPAEILRVVPVANGHRACQIEKRMHADLRRRFPDAVVPPARFAQMLRVGSEIYVEELAAHLHDRLDQIATKAGMTGVIRQDGEPPVSGPADQS